MPAVLFSNSLDRGRVFFLYILCVCVRTKTLRDHWDEGKNIIQKNILKIDPKIYPKNLSKKIS
jgi:hypothetical protein